MLYNNEITYRELYRWGCGQLEEAQIAEAELDARLLLEWCCGTDRNTLLAHGERCIAVEEYDKYMDCIVKRSGHIPLQHIIGEQDFMGLTFRVNEKVLIPRQDTEVLVEEVMRHLHDGMHILDMCTGSGCILLSLLHYSNDCTGVGVDVSEEALRVAQENTARIFGSGSSLCDVTERKPESITVRNIQGDPVREDGGVQADGQIKLLRSNLFEQLDSRDRFDIIVSNPPYIKTGVIDSLMPEVREHEPRLALDGQEDGLFFYREITAQAGAYLVRGGMLFFEIGYDQGEAVRRLMESAGYEEVEVVKDFAGLDRVVHGVYGVINTM